MAPLYTSSDMIRVGMSIDEKELQVPFFFLLLTKDQPPYLFSGKNFFFSSHNFCSGQRAWIATSPGP